MSCDCCRCLLWAAEDNDGHNKEHCETCLELEDKAGEEGEGFLSKLWKFVNED